VLSGRIARMMDLSGRGVLVTGGAGHVGRAAAETVAELGAGVAVLDRVEDDVRRVTKDLVERFGVPVASVTLDLEAADGVHDAITSVAGRLGGLDVIVHCAAFVGSSELDGWIGPFGTQTIATWRRALEVNLTAPFAITQAAEPYLRRTGHGCVINISSIYGSAGPDMRLYDGLDMGNPAAYSASKGGLEQLTRWLATTLAPHVRVNAIAPGGIARNQPAQFVERYAARTPLARLATEDDLKGAVAYLATDLSCYVTGQVLAVDGGWSAW
jgi:NAD(P)-dependent dehydrogenase (short-subunit alcohol dehydrogenase family)